MSTKNAQAVKLWRNKTKERIVEAMGGCCQICGYAKCNRALELHHIDPSQKELSFGSIRANPKSWSKIVDELKKSILLCSNCHKEVHDGITNIPETFQTFNKSFTDYRNSITTERKCQVENCDNNLTHGQKAYCSVKCANSAMTIGWDDLYDLKFVQKLSNIKISKIKGCSETTVRHRVSKLTH